jgi:uncharacterized protein (DUF2384 family)
MPAFLPMNARSQIAEAIAREIRRQEQLLASLDKVDETLFDLALTALETPENAATWLLAPNPELGGRPLDVLAIESGRARVMTLLGRIEYGVL